jgi:hypothetical protein
LAVFRGTSLNSLTKIAANTIGQDLIPGLAFSAEVNQTYYIALDSEPLDAALFRLKLTPVPVRLNDDFENRLHLSGTWTQVDFSNTGATLQPGEPNPSGPFANSTLWWNWTAPASGLTTIDTYGSWFDTRLAVYAGTSLNALNLVTIDDDESGDPYHPLSSSRVTFNAQAGIEYQIQVGGVAGASGIGQLTLFGQPVPLASIESIDIPERRLHILGTPGQTTWIQFSDDLVHWGWSEPIQLRQATEVWLDQSTPLYPWRFYKVVSNLP